jgi:hypothetical protein
MGAGLPEAGPRSTPLQQALAAAIVLASILVPVVTAVIAAMYANSSAQREANLRLVELAVGILQQPPKPEALDIRIWALDVIDAHADVRMPVAARASLQKATSFPVYVTHTAQWEKGRLWLGGEFIALPDSGDTTRKR